MTNEEIKTGTTLPDGWRWDDRNPCGVIKGDGRDYRIAMINDNGLYGSLHYRDQMIHHAAPVPVAVAKILIGVWEQLK